MILSCARGALGLFASSVLYRIEISEITDIGCFICSLFRRCSFMDSLPLFICLMKRMRIGWYSGCEQYALKVALCTEKIPSKSTH